MLYDNTMGVRYAVVVRKETGRRLPIYYYLRRLVSRYLRPTGAESVYNVTGSPFYIHIHLYFFFYTYNIIFKYSTRHYVRTPDSSVYFYLPIS